MRPMFTRKKAKALLLFVTFPFFLLLIDLLHMFVDAQEWFDAR